ncbi:hypothetical protein [Aeromonas phage AS-zj]|uniref:Uncharacterized protein n=2 Tax=Ceceduovirus TaxID=2842588 RepID=A0A223LFE6_9CAUD|nr:hypothetical protein HWB28_gp091 [Aeromonas phage AS-zj]YP_009835024.1 hypothetical protein HWB29_gp322 [Aeromonas phage AS-sw]ASU00461.1 hypothetical protein [Aeromonas phage AS-zj]ATI18372.1 hypothetical protein [Aeromonas phage AS-sw]
MAKQKKAVQKVEEKKLTGRQGYKRKSNGRVDQFGDALRARVRRAMKAEAFASKSLSHGTRDEATQASTFKF